MEGKYLRDVFGNFLIENGETYKDMVVLDADLSSSTRTNKFAKKFPNRFFNFGIAEQNMVGASIGFAISDKIPIVSGFSIFTTGRAWEFIRLICHDNLNVKIITTHGGIVGEDGSTHNALEDFSLMSSLPNLSVLVPSDIIELNSMLHYALNTKGPFYIRLPREGFSQVHNDGYTFSIGNSDILKDGADICLIGIGYGTSLALNAAEKLEKQHKISVKVINQPTIKPINAKNLISSIKNINKIIIIEEHNIYCGVGNILSRVISENDPKMIKILGINDSFGESGSRELLLHKYRLTLKDLIKIVEEIIK
jgi:transketolase